MDFEQIPIHGKTLLLEEWIAFSFFLFYFSFFSKQKKPLFFTCLDNETIIIVQEFPTEEMRSGKAVVSIVGVVFVYIGVLITELQLILPMYPVYNKLNSVEERFLIAHKRKAHSSLDSLCSEDPLMIRAMTVSSKPITIRQMRLCDQALQPMFSHNREQQCPGDPTCVSCRRETIQKMTTLS